MADRSVLVRIRGDANDLIRATASARTAIGGLRKEIDTTNDRTAWMAQSFLALGPALAPLGASAVPVLAGLAAQMTAAGLAGTSMALAFIGIGDTMKAVNDYQLEPTAENFNKMQVALEDFGPAGADFVRFLDSVGPKFDQLQLAARDGMFPGMEDGIRSFMDLLPQAERIIGNVSEAIGGLSAEAGAGLAGPEFEEFFNYLETDAAPLLRDMGHIVGNFGKGFADMLVDFAPLTEDFSSGFVEMSESFAEWTDGLGESEGFSEFIAYVERSVPKVLDTFGALADAFVQILEAAAPVGDVMLPALEALFDVIAKIADTPLGTAFIGAAAVMSTYGRAAALARITTGGLGTALFGVDKGFRESLKGANGAIARVDAFKTSARLASGGVGLLALSMTDLDEKAGLSNTAMGALTGMMVGGPWGAAIGGAIGGTMDLAAANDDLEDAITRADQALNSMATGALRRSRDELRDLLQDTEQGLTLDSFFEDLFHVGDDSDFGTAAMNKVSGAADEARVKLHEVNNALDMGDAADLLAGPLGLTADAFHTAAMSAEEFRDAVASAFGLLDKRASLRAAREAVREFTHTLEDAPNKMQKGSAAYDKVEEALDDIARSSLEAAENLRGMDRVRFLDKQRGTFIQAARDMGLTAQRARHLADDLGLLDKTQVKPTIDGDVKPLDRKLNQARNWMNDWGREKESSTVDADNKPARGKIDEANQWLDILGRKATHPKIDVESNAAAVAAQTNLDLNSIQDEEVWITTRRRGTSLGAVPGADGMTVPGARAPYGDKVYSFLAPGEEVISNRFGQADRHRELLKAINSNSYADGGTVARQAAVSASVSVAAPRVSLAGAQITAVFPGVGRVFGQVVDARIEADRTYRTSLDDRD